MANVNSYKCDYCETFHKEANHWFVGVFIKPKLATQAEYVTIHPWSQREDLEMQSRKFDKFAIRDLCGQACAHKFVDEFLSK